MRAALPRNVQVTKSKQPLNSAALQRDMISVEIKRDAALTVLNFKKFELFLLQVNNQYYVAVVSSLLLSMHSVSL